MQPSSLVDVLRSDRDKPMLAVPQVRAKLHDHIRKLVQVWPRAEVLNCFVLEHADLLGREAVHFNHFQRLPIQFEGEGKLFQLF